MKKVLLVTLFAIIFGSLAAQAQNIQPRCVSGCAPEPANPGVNPNNGFFQLGYAFGQWLFGGNSRANAEEEALRQQQQQLMMAEVRRREEEAARLHQEEEARRLAAMYNRLASTLKLSGLPHLELKSSGISTGGLQMKMGDSAQGYGIAGLPGIYTGGPASGSSQTSQTGSKLQLKMGDGATDQQGYGIAGLPGIYTNGPGSGSGMSAPVQPVTGGSAATPSTAAGGVSDRGAVDFNKATPQQLADAADAFSKLPPEEQQRAMTAGQNGPATPQQASPPPTTGSTAEPTNPAPASGPAQATAPVMTPQTAALPVASLQQQASASQSAATATAPENASANARAGFDTPLESAATQPATITTATQVSARTQTPASPAAQTPQVATPAQSTHAHIDPRGLGNTGAGGLGRKDVNDSGSGAPDLKPVISSPELTHPPQAHVRIGAAAEIRGDVYWLTSDGRKVPITPGGAVYSGARIVTGENARMRVLLLDQTVFTMGPYSDMVLDEFVYDPDTSSGKVSVKVSKGIFRFVTGKAPRKDPADLKVTLPEGTIGIRGTDVEIDYQPGAASSICLFLGELEITESKSGKTFTMHGGQMMVIASDGSFSAPSALNPHASPKLLLEMK